MRRIVRLTESDLNRLVTRVINEQPFEHEYSDEEEAINKFIDAGDIFFKAFLKIPDSKLKDEVFYKMNQSFEEIKRHYLRRLRSRIAMARTRSSMD